MLIILKDQDLAFSEIAQGARVDGTTLPSGLKVPVTPGFKWVISGQVVRCIEDTDVPPNVQAQLPE